MKRSAQKVKIDSSGKVTFCYKITCMVTGEMCDGRKVWTDLETGEQYFLYKVSNHYIFMK